jgi:hypothetical protein
MPRVKVPTPVCPRCLDETPGMPAGDPNTPHPGPFADKFCVSCELAVAKERVSIPGSKFYPIAPHFIAVRPMQVWPRPNGPEMPDGPLCMAHGPRDYEGQGREAFWDQTPEERATALPAMVHDAGLNCATKVDARCLGTASENKAFAKGWLSELDRVKQYSRKEQL